MDFEMISKYIEPRLLVLVPTLWGMGMAFRQSKMENKYIPVILLVFSCFITATHITATHIIFDFSGIMATIFASVTQGCVIWLVAWSTYEKFLHIKD